MNAKITIVMLALHLSPQRVSDIARCLTQIRFGLHQGHFNHKATKSLLEIIEFLKEVQSGLQLVEHSE